MALEIQHNTHGIDKSYNEAKPQHSEQHARLLKETDDKDIRASLKADHEKASKQTTDLPKIELVDGAKTAESGLTEQKKKEKTIEGDAAQERHVKRAGDSLPAIELVDAKISQGKTAQGEEGKEPNDKTAQLLSPAKGEAERLEKALEESHSLAGRSRANCEKDLRDTFATLNSQGVAKLVQDYQERFGKSFSATIEGDDKISAQTKAALAIYMKGADKRTDQDTLELADLALKAKNLDMFQEAFREASEGARKQYIEQGGLAKVEEAFSKTDQAHALDYVTAGKLGIVTKINDNASAFGDNEKAIDLALKNMSDDERHAYIHGKALAEKFPQSLSSGEGAYSKLTAQEKADYDQYLKVHDALTKIGSVSEVLRWDDLAVNKEQTLVGKMAEHGGLINDKLDNVLVDIENMNKSEFQRLKEEPRHRADLEEAIAANYRGQDLVQARELLDKKLSFATFEEAQEGGNRATIDALKNKFGILGPDDQGILDTLQKMSPDEQKRYRDDAEYKKQIDGLVDLAFHNRMPDVDAKRILENVSHGGKPEEDIVGKLAVQVNSLSHDRSGMLSEIESAFKQDPGLRERLAHPQTDADRASAEKFKDYARGTFGSSDFESYVKPLLENGEFPLAQKVNFHDGLIHNDIKGVLDSLKTASAQERSALVAAPDQVLSFLSSDERQLVLNVAQHNGEMRDEDKMRAAVLGMSGDKEIIKEMGSQLTEEQRVQLAQDYEKQYGKNLAVELADKLSGQEEVDAVRSFKGLLQNVRESFNEARDEEYRSNDGIGRSFVRDTWDGTADASRDALNQYATGMIEAAKLNQEMSVEQNAKLKSDLIAAVDLYRESKGAAADALVDGTIIAAGVGGAAFTGGVSLGLITTTGVAGAVLKVGTKSIIMGDDYRFNSSEMLGDAVSGAVGGATVVIGPVQMAKMLQIGEKASVVATEGVLSESARLAEQTGKQLLTAEASQTLSQDLSREVATGLAQGAREIDEKVIDKLAQKYAVSEAEQTEVKVLLTTKLNEAIASESGSVLKSTLREVALNSGAGSVAGGSMGAVEGVQKWDSSKGFGENIQVVGEETLAGSVMGGAMGSAFTLGFKGLGKGFESARQLAREHSVLGDDIGNIAASGEFIHDANGRLAQINGPNPLKVSYHEEGNLEGAVKKIEMADGTTYENLGGSNWLVLDGAHGRVREIDARVTVNHTGEVQIRQADGSSKIVSGVEGWVKEFDKASGETHLRDADGRLIGLEARNGHNTQYQYDSNGRLDKVQMENGFSFHSDDAGKSWVMKDATGESKTIEGTVVLEADGTLHVKSFEVNGTATGREASGNSAEQEQVFRKDGSYSHIDPLSGKPADLVMANGRREQYEYAPNGSLLRLTINGRSQQLHSDETVSIGHDGTKSTIIDKSEILEFTDGGRLVRNVENQRVLQEKPPQNLHLAREAEVEGKSPAEVNEQRKVIEKEFASTKGIDAPGSIRQVELELKAVATIGGDGQPVSVYKSLMSSETLSSMQKENVLRNLAQAREHLAGSQEDDVLGGNAAENWLETQGAVAKVLDAATVNKLSAGETEDALLASIYSHAIKSDASPEQGASGKSLSGNLDAALVAEHVLGRDGLPAQRVDGIVEAIRAKQNAELGSLPLERQLDPGFKQLSRLEQEEVLSGSRIAQTVLDGDASLLKVTSDGAVLGQAQVGGVAGSFSLVDKSLLEAQSLELPGIKPEAVKPGEPPFVSEEHHLKAWRSSETYRLYTFDTDSEIMRTYDSNHRLLALDSDERALKVNYGFNGDVESVSLRRPGNGESGSESESIKLVGDWSREIKVDADGTVKVVRHGFDGDEVQRYNLDGSVERFLANGRVEYEKADFALEKGRLEEAFTKAFQENSYNLDRLERVKGYMAEFELEAGSHYRNLDQNAQALLYKQLNRLLVDRPDTVVPFSERLDIAEQALQHSAEPWSVAQGQNGTCNVATIEHRIYWRNPDKNVQMLADLAETGKYRFASGTEIDMRSNLGRLYMDEHSAANLLWQNIVKYDGHTDAPILSGGALKRGSMRDFSSEILQTAMVNSRWSKNVAVVDGEGRQLTGQDLAMRYDRNGEAIGLVNGREVKQLYDEQGKVVREIRSDAQYYYKDKTAVEKLAQWQGIYSKEGNLQGVISEGTQLKSVYDVTGKKVLGEIDESVPSGKYFDENGDLLVLYTQPGDLQYRKFPVRGEREAERLMVNVNGESKELKFPNGSPVSSPQLYEENLLLISRDVTGLDEKPFVLAFDSTEANVVGFKSEEEFIAALRKLEAENNLPGILKVDATHAPFNAPPSFGTSGLSTNGHVINVHGVGEAPDPRYVSFPGTEDSEKTRLVIYMSNQWGPRANTYVEFTGDKYHTLMDGYPAADVYKATKPYKAQY